MACFRPLTAWQLEGGEIVFAERGKVRRELRLPCGRCIGCRLKRTRSWAMRCVHEASCHDANCFITLTYNNDHYSPSLEYRDVQLFLYRVRKAFGSGIRFFVAGEYSPINLRPHWHMLMFGRTFTDVYRVAGGYASHALDSLWEFGFNTVGTVTPQSAAYCAKYSCKKWTGVDAEKHYERVDLRTGEYVQVVPEFARMSLRPGIGYNWFQRYWRDIYVARDGIVQHGGQVVAAPRYYDELLERLDFDLRDWKSYVRYVSSGKFASDCTPERLAVREFCALKRQQMLKERNI